MPEPGQSGLLVEIAREVGEYRSLLRNVARTRPADLHPPQSNGRGEEPTTISGAAGALPGALLAALSGDLGRPLAIVVADEEESERIRQDLAAAGLARVFHAPAPALTPYQRIPPSLKARRDEFALLAALAEPAGVGAIVLPARSLFTRLPASERLRELSFALQDGQEISLTRFVGELTRVGYRRADLVIETGDLAVRGGLFDIFPPDRDLPLRVELDGDRIASMRVFDPDTQRSRERLASVVIPPFAFSEDALEPRTLMEQRIGRLPSEAERIVFAPAVEAMPAGWLDHARGAIVVVVEPSAVDGEIDSFAERVESDRDPERDFFAPEELLHPVERIRAVIGHAGLLFDRVGLSARGSLLRVPAEPIAAHSGRTAEAAGEISRAIAAGEEIFVAVRPTGGAEKLRRFALEYSLHVSSERRPGALVCIPAEISAGFRLRHPRLAVYSESEIFGEEKRSAVARGRPSEAFLSDLRDLKLGDAVVHREYGIGLFQGLTRVPVEGEEREFMEIGYAEDKRLLLPVERLDLVQKYSGVEGVQPALDKLGGAGWARRKASV
ncbi:MAG TPA: CarD family transcriptional regulator, partial [Thermoanaerobaculia bacterium]|nr:CarD family transcriptional regulator [Thermoanaerobaculia bacterium]